jgi:hypothetical protein
MVPIDVDVHVRPSALGPRDAGLAARPAVPGKTDDH